MHWGHPQLQIIEDGPSLAGIEFNDGRDEEAGEEKIKWQQQTLL
jgi:hypothetical protein